MHIVSALKKDHTWALMSQQFELELTGLISLAGTMADFCTPTMAFC
jgi:hypothetical protein